MVNAKPRPLYVREVETCSHSVYQLSNQALTQKVADGLMYPPPQKKIKKIGRFFLDTMLENVSLDLPSSQNQPLTNTMDFSEIK